MKANKAQFVAGQARRAVDRAEQLFQVGVLFALVMVPLLMLLAGLQLGQELRRGRELREAVNLSYERRADILDVFARLQDAESAQRGYVITRDPGMLAAYRTARDQTREGMAALARSLADEPVQRDGSLRLVSLAERRLQLLGAGLDALPRQGVTGAAAIATGPGVAQMTAVRDQVDRLVQVEAAALEQRVAEEQSRSASAGRAIVLLFVLLGTAVIVSGLLFLRHVQGRRELLERVEDVAARQQAVLDSAIDAIVTLNPSGTIETINAAGQRMFGYGSADLVRRDLSAVLEMDEEREGPFLERLIGPEQTLTAGVTQEMTGRRRGGAGFPVDVSLAEMRLPDGLRVVAIVRDLSERRRVNQLKEEFVSTVSHELRTPLTSIAGSLGLVSAGAAGELPEQARRLVGIALTNCRRLVRLINDILDIEKMESGSARFDLRPAPLGEIAARSVEDTRGFAENLGVRLRLETDGSAPMIRADADRLVQVAVNLLSNAAKFSPAGGEVVVCVATADDRARLSVRDNGPGVPEEFRARIFSKFAQADGADNRQKGGTGLGLVIAKEIVERHGGRLWYEDPPGGGAEFHAEFAKIGEHAAVSEPGVRLLVCEDEVVTAAALREVLEDEGFVVDVAETLADAEQALRRAEYACFVTDLNLPDGNGLDLIRRQRADVDTRRIPAIVVSGDAARNSAAPGVAQLGIAAWMDKPVEPSRLRDAILAAVSGGRRPVILHVDDDRDMLQITAAALSGCGEVVSADSLAEARAAIARRRPDLVVLDIGLSDGSGLELLPDLKVGGGAPVVVFTAQSGDGLVADDADAILTKSRTSLSALARTVRRLLAERPVEQLRDVA